MNIYQGKLQFKGTFRSYQQRVLDNSKEYLKDKRIHVVAAPGSGKTTLGIELITRLGAPCLILSPSITIRTQWGERIKDAFLKDGENIEDWVSDSIRSPKAITTITYQALHSAYSKYSGELEEESLAFTEYSDDKTDEEQDSLTKSKEEVDFKDFDLFDTIKKAGIQTLCLDEAHHLRSEWWKALEQLVKNFPEFTVISLTATPPYDSNAGEWEKYIGLCGPIDEEIFTPELVKEHSLCPHQDYVYFNYPTKEELSVMEEFQKKSKECSQSIQNNPEFKSAIANHKGLKSPEEYTSFFLERPDYFYSILIYLTSQGINLSPYVMDLVGENGTLPPMDDGWMEKLLQGFLYEDVESYENSEALRESLLTQLKTNQCIQKRKVALTSNNALQKMLISSKGKLNSIITIAEKEYEDLGKSLRQLILCDYIKKEFLTCINKPEIAINDMGVLPTFELLRRKALPGLKLGVLCGTIVIIPKTATGALDYLLVENDATAKYTPTADPDYVQVNVSGNQSLMVKMITNLFQTGEMQILIGTKSLLGEGWDSPCINSLILASFVGSFMLSNQMRGRAIRMFKDDPDKISNIWHLLCVEPATNDKNATTTSTDYEMLKRRFQSFLGVSYTKDVIENGLERLSIIKEPFTEENVNAINTQMLTMAKDRASLKKRWETALFNPTSTNKDMAIEETVEVKPSNPAASYRMKLPLKQLLICLLAFIVSSVLKNVAPWFLGFLLFPVKYGFLIAAIVYAIKTFRLFTSSQSLAKIASALLQALKKTGQIQDNSARIASRKQTDGTVIIHLQNGTTRDKSTFAKSLTELLGDIDSPRYLMVRKAKKKSDHYQYISVPECLGRKKTDAEILKQGLTKILGDYNLLYVHTPEGKEALLKARTHSMSHSKKDTVTSKKQLL